MLSFALLAFAGFALFAMAVMALPLLFFLVALALGKMGVEMRQRRAVCERE